jgi:hypothetical protein
MLFISLPKTMDTEDCRYLSRTHIIKAPENHVNIDKSHVVIPLVRHHSPIKRNEVVKPRCCSMSCFSILTYEFYGVDFNTTFLYISIKGVHYEETYPGDYIVSANFVYSI